MPTKKHTSKGEHGFSLLEVVLSMSFILILVLAATNMLRSTIDKRQGLAQQARVTHRLTSVMNRIASDLQHSYLISPQSAYNPGGRKTGSIFRNVRSSISAELMMTTMNHQSKLKNSYESDQTFVIYRVKDAKDSPGRSHLFRGESKVIPENFSDEPNMNILARNIKALNVYPWNGDGWDKNKWDSKSSDRRNKLPKMVKVEIEAWEEEGSDRENERLDKITTTLKTVIYIPRSFGIKEPKNPVTTIKYY